jgi:uncharacterized protein YndB with AHSA1/START domain
MKVAEAEIEIAAPIELVWSVMLDVAKYGEWNPFLHQIDCKETPRAGSELMLHVKWEGGGGASSKERITKLDGPANGTATLEYIFEGFLATIGAVRGTRVQRLRQNAAGTIYHTREEFGGWLQMFLPLKSVQKGFEAHARSLKSRAEQLAAGG